LNKLFALALCILAGLIVPPKSALAHRMNAAMSLVEISPSSGKLQVTHRLFAHDLEGALGARSVDMAWFETPQGKAALRDYCLAQFVVRGHNNRVIALTLIGVEVDGAVIHAYFEGPRLRGPTIVVDSNFLQDISESQVNQVNVRANGRTVSAIFQTGTDPKRIVLPVRSR
jgi:hypothetical protein